MRTRFETEAQGDSKKSCYMKVTRSAGKQVRVSHHWFWFYFLIQLFSVVDTKRFKLFPVFPQQEVQHVTNKVSRENTKGSLLTF